MLNFERIENNKKRNTAMLNELKTFFILLSFVFLVACNEELKTEKEEVIPASTPKKYEQADSLASNITVEDNLNTVEVEKELQQNLILIEQKYGEQWGFCECVIRNDSVNKAFQTVSDEDFETLMIRSDYIDKKCKAFLAQDTHRTPEERAKREMKVKKCLTEANNQLP